MSNKTRKYIWPVSLAMSLVLVGVLAAFVVIATSRSQTAQAHGPCDFQTQTGADFARCVATDGDVAGHTHEDDTTTGDMMGAAGDVTVESSSTSGSATVELKLTVKLKDDVPVGGAFVLYLEDDYAMPESISAGDVYFVSIPPE